MLTSMQVAGASRLNSEENYVNRRTTRIAVSASLAAGLAGGLLLGPISPTFAAVGESQQCTVDSAELRWGVKERFRNYISGSIANGEWTTENGASYESPTFIWANGTGEMSAGLDQGSVKFSGDVHFTGHGGAMKLDLQDPELVFTSPNTAQLILGMGSSDTEGSEVSLERVVAGAVDLTRGDSSSGTSYSIANAPVRLTAEGASAFNGEYGDYVSGDEMDTLALSVAVSGCQLAATAGEEVPATEEPSESATPEPVPAPGAPEVPWVPIVIGGVALLAIAVTSGMLIAGRKKKSAQGDDATGDGAAADPEAQDPEAQDPGTPN